MPLGKRAGATVADGTPDDDDDDDDVTPPPPPPPPKCLRATMACRVCDTQPGSVRSDRSLGR